MSDLPPPPPDDSGWSSDPPPPPPGPSATSGGSDPGMADLGTGDTIQLASAGARLGARILDIIIVGVIGFIVSFVEPVFIPIVVGAAYEIMFVALRGQTPGKMAASIKIVRADNGTLPPWGASVGRWIIPAIGYALLILPGLLVHASLLWDDQRRGWHDKAVKTVVVKV